MVPASQPFLAYMILPAWPGPPPLLSRGGVHKSAPHWICSWARPNKWVPIEKQAHAMGKTKDLRTSAILLKSVTSEAPAFLHIP